METDELPNVDLNIDYETILPIQQKRTITFINNFLTNTISFFNTFSQSCESRLMEFNYKLQKLEASLLILEAQLASIPDDDNNSHQKENSKQDSQNLQDIVELPKIDNAEINATPNESSPNDVIASQHPKYASFFKMVHVGVPAQAVKLKMIRENLDPSILDKPNEVIPASPADTSNINISSTNSNS
ncbi:hypothetical protein AMK59_7570 [Oryctes borbonicus]|uniref:WASH complex subunit CCDC53 n=1 Tax=Oryctes borbonicus TaxID=1629725 RepID=A0A0T6AX41_9SCAR|nr:hypothetical protein AMK59_7570 [Oryctes borbonicus]